MLNPQAAFCSRAGSVQLDILAHGAARLSLTDLALVRQQSLDRFVGQLRPQLVKHSDDQTLAAAVALDRALDQMPVGSSFADWAVVSATKYLGRTAFASVIDKYKIDGPWGVSVQVIPHTSPHALASTLSLAMGSHGPCFGAGVAPGEESQAFLTAATLVERGGISGAWIVLSGWQQPGRNPADEGPHCVAALVAVAQPQASAVQQATALGSIRIGTIADAKPVEANRTAPNLAEWLTEYGQPGRPVSQERYHAASGGMSLDVTLCDRPAQRPLSAAPIRPPHSLRAVDSKPAPHFTCHALEPS